MFQHPREHHLWIFTIFPARDAPWIRLFHKHSIPRANTVDDRHTDWVSLVKGVPYGLDLLVVRLEVCDFLHTALSLLKVIH